MTDIFEHQGERLARAVRRACHAALSFGVYPECLYPKCRCKKLPIVARTIIEEWEAVPSHRRPQHRRRSDGDPD